MCVTLTELGTASSDSKGRPVAFYSCLTHHGFSKAKPALVPDALAAEEADFSFKRPPNNIWTNQLTRLDTVSQSQRRLLLFPVKKELTATVKYQEPLNIFLDVFKSQH